MQTPVRDLAINEVNTADAEAVGVLFLGSAAFRAEKLSLSEDSD